MTILGIDFGTSRIKAAYWETGKGVVKMLPSGKGGRVYMPSLFYIDREGGVRFGDEAEAMRYHDSLGMLDNLKLKLDKAIQYLPDERQVKSSVLMSLLFGQLIEYSSRKVKVFGCKPPQTLVLTLPARLDYGDIYSDALDAAGFKGKVIFIREPEAAAWAWIAEKKPNRGAILVVFDFGGGTVDWATVQVDENQRPRMIPDLPPGGTSAAGSHVDEGLFDIMMYGLEDEQRAYALENRSMLMMQIRQMKELQYEDATQLGRGRKMQEIMLGAEVFRFEPESYDGVVKREVLDKVQEGIISYIRKVVIYAKRYGNDLVECVLVGGTRLLSGLETHVKAIVEMVVEEESGIDVRFAELSEADFAAVQGAVQCCRAGKALKTGLGSNRPSSGRCDDNGEEMLSSLAQQGDAKAMVDLANIYFFSEGAKQNYVKAVKWYRIAADQGRADAQCTLGFMYGNGKGVQKNVAEAIRWYRLAAGQGNAKACCNLGVMYFEGIDVAQNYVEAANWYRLAAEKGNPTASCNLGVMYEKGVGLQQNHTEAVKWYRIASELGNANAQCSLGFMYEKGLGVLKSIDEAVKWYRRSAMQGNTTAACNLGVMYYNGQGVAQSYSEAVKWYRLAADQGNETARNYLELIGKKRLI